MTGEKEKFYQGAAWKRARLAALRRDRWICQDCLARIRASGRKGAQKPAPATMVHHIYPLETHPELALTLSNLVSLCDSCHNKRHPEKLDGKRPQKEKQENPLTAGMQIYRI